MIAIFEIQCFVAYEYHIVIVLTLILFLHGRTLTFFSPAGWLPLMKES